MDHPAKHKYERLKQDLNRLRDLSVHRVRLPGSTTHGGPIGDIALDDAKRVGEDFFIHCHSFKDWLAKEHPALRASVEAYITNSPALSLAADYANAQKHGGLDRAPRSARRLEKINQATKVDHTPDGWLSSAKLILTVDGQQIDGLQVAEDCLRDWEQFLAANAITL